jgi:membrane-associated protease RseP (regulator of RpoE activity)
VDLLSSMKPTVVFRRCLIKFMSLALMSAGLGLRAAKAAPVNTEPLQMEPVLVSTIYTSIKLRPVLRESALGGRQVIALLRIEQVRRKSPAERAGLLPGYEVLAINGVDVKGLDEAALDKLWRGPFFDDLLVLRVAPIRPGRSSPAHDVRIPLKKEPPITLELSFRLGAEGSPPSTNRCPGEARSPVGALNDFRLISDPVPILADVRLNDSLL